MKPAFADTGIILKVVDFAEADKLVGVLSHNHGYQEYVARGARRLNSKKAPHLDLFNQIKFQVGRGNNPQLLVQADTINYYPAIKSGLEKARIAMSLAEIITSVLPYEEEDRQTYLSLTNFFEAIDLQTDRSNLGKITYDFSLYLLRHLGYPLPSTVSPENITGYFETIINKKIISRQLR
ncbi:MAG TPA: DNA repair protein RecO [Patescibacteria group bacterium]